MHLRLYIYTARAGTLMHVLLSQVVYNFVLDAKYVFSETKYVFPIYNKVKQIRPDKHMKLFGGLRLTTSLYGDDESGILIETIFAVQSTRNLDQTETLVVHLKQIFVVINWRSDKFYVSKGFVSELKYMTCICNLFTRKRASKASYRSPKTTFLAYFHVFAETISGLIIKIPLIWKKISLLWDLN